jgi:hypothetical protein
MKQNYLPKKKEIASLCRIKIKSGMNRHFERDEKSGPASGDTANPGQSGKLLRRFGALERRKNKPFFDL